MNEFLSNVLHTALDVGWNIFEAFVLWVVGRRAIEMVHKLTAKTFERRKLDETLARYLQSALGIMLNLLLIVAILSVFGVETTSFAALFAAAGVAIGMAWSGLLSNFAAGVMMILLRPFKSGDFVEAGGQVGTVVEVGLFVTAIDTMDNVRTFIGNSAVFSGTIKNFSANPVRRVDCKAQLAHGADHQAAIKTLKAALAKAPHVAQDPAPQVDILDFTLAGPVLSVRPFTHTDTYWDVWFETNRIIREELGALNLPVPETHHHVSK